MKQADVNHHKTNHWLRSNGLKAETEGLIAAAQNQSLATRSYHGHIIKDSTNPSCKIRGKYKTVDHIVSGCPELAKTEYINRHDTAASHMHGKVCQNFNINITKKWYDHQQKESQKI